MSIQHKILFGYFISVAVIASMAAVLLYERKRVQEIEDETMAIRQVKRDGNIILRHITILATYGETAIAWDEEDYAHYHSLRLHVDSMLQAMQGGNEEFVRQNQIDTLRYLLASKEEHLFHIRRLFREQGGSDSLLLGYLPVAARPRTVTRKKKGIAGWFGAKETVQVPSTTSATLRSLNSRLLSMQEKRQRSIDLYTDSLRSHNRELNRKLRVLMTSMNEHAERVLQAKEYHVKTSYDRSILIITWLIISAIVLIAISYLIIHKDIREKVRNRKRLEETVRKLQDNIEENRRLIEARRRIIQTVAHELRTPLAAIVGNAELIENDKKAERLRHLCSIRQSAGRMVSLLTNLMNYFRLDNGKEQTDPKPFHLRSIADTLHTEFVPQAEAKQLAFQVKNCKDDIVVGDKDLILRIGSNLLSNAVKFTEQGLISLSVAYQSGIFTMIVEDTGSGISQEQQERIYRPFERLTNAATQDGFGLGLTIVQELIELMKGELSLESVPGKGSRFRITLPLARAEETASGTGYAPTPQPLHNISVLVLDNDDVLLSMTRDMLVRQKIDCDTCRNVRELLERIRVRNYNLLITDLKMPDMNGYEVMELLRSSDIGNSRSIPVIVSTAMEKSSETELLARGFSGCLFKPFSSDEAALAIASCIGGTQEWQKIDLSPLLAYGEKAEILERLITETKKEMAAVREAYKKRDIGELDTLIHHLRSSWMVVNADYPLRELYDLIHLPQYDETSLWEKVQAVLENGERIILAAQKTKEGLWEK